MKTVDDFEKYLEAVVALGKAFGVPEEMERAPRDVVFPARTTIEIYSDYIEEVRKNANP